MNRLLFPIRSHLYLQRRHAQVVSDNLKRSSNKIPVGQTSSTSYEKHKSIDRIFTGVFVIIAGVAMWYYGGPHFERIDMYNKYESSVMPESDHQGYHPEKLKRWVDAFKELSTNQAIAVLSMLRVYTDEPVFFDLYRHEESRDFIVQFIKNNPTLLNVRNLNGYDLIIDLLKKNCPEEQILELLELGGNVNQKDKHGRSTLEHIITYTNSTNSKELLVKFVEKGADLNYHVPFMVEENRVIKATLESRTRQLVGEHLLILLVYL